MQTNQIKIQIDINQTYFIIHTFDLRRTLPKYLRTFLHGNAVLTIGLTDQSDYSICLINGQTFHPYSTKYRRPEYLVNLTTSAVWTRSPNLSQPIFRPLQGLVCFYMIFWSKNKKIDHIFNLPTSLENSFGIY